MPGLVFFPLPCSGPQNISFMEAKGYNPSCLSLILGNGAYKCVFFFDSLHWLRAYRIPLKYKRASCSHKVTQTSVLKSLPSAMVASRKMLYFVFFFFFILAQLPSGKWECVGFWRGRAWNMMILLRTTLKLRVTVSSPLHFSWEFLESAVAFSKSKLLLIFFLISSSWLPWELGFRNRIKMLPLWPAVPGCIVLYSVISYTDFNFQILLCFEFRVPGRTPEFPAIPRR